jgi:hypothetical protein
MKKAKYLYIQTIVLLRSLMSFSVSFPKKDMSFFGKQREVCQERHRECVWVARRTSSVSIRQGDHSVRS